VPGGVPSASLGGGPVAWPPGEPRCRADQKPSALVRGTHGSLPCTGAAVAPRPWPSLSARSGSIVRDHGPGGGSVVPRRPPGRGPCGPVPRSMGRSWPRWPGPHSHALACPRTTASTPRAGGWMSSGPPCRWGPRRRGVSGPGGGVTAGKPGGKRSGSRRARSGRASRPGGSAGQRRRARPSQAPARRWKVASGGRGNGGRRFWCAWTGAWARPRCATGCAVGASRSGPRAVTRAGGRSGARPAGRGRPPRGPAAPWPPCGAPIAAVGRRASGGCARQQTQAALPRRSWARAWPSSHPLPWRMRRTAGP